MSRRSFGWLAAVLFVVVGVGSGVIVQRARRAERWPTPVRPATAMGDSTCISCHRDKASYEGTAHRLTIAASEPRDDRGPLRRPARTCCARRTRRCTSA